MVCYKVTGNQLKINAKLFPGASSPLKSIHFK